MDILGPIALRNDGDGLATRFREMSRRRLTAFLRQFLRARSFANPVNREGVLSRDGNLGEDAGDDFAVWVVCRGRDYWSGLDAESFPQRRDDFSKATPGIRGRTT